MIDPIKMTRYDLSQTELEEVLLFCIAVAGHNALTTARLLDNFLRECHWKILDLTRRVPVSPFAKLVMIDRFFDLKAIIQECRLGRYGVLTKAFRALAYSGMDLKTCTLAELEAIPGVGPKTSRFFTLHTRRNIDVAVLDVHILRYMADCGIAVPKSTPNGKRYADLEQKFLEMARQSGKTVAAFDLEIWNEYRQKK